MDFISLPVTFASIVGGNGENHVFEIILFNQSHVLLQSSPSIVTFISLSSLDQLNELILENGSAGLVVWLE